MAVEHFRATHFLAAVRPEHQAFYKRTFRHNLICPARPYAMLKSPIALMSVGYEEAVSWVYDRYPFFRSNVFERRMLFETQTDTQVPLPAGDTIVPLERDGIVSVPLDQLQTRQEGVTRM